MLHRTQTAHLRGLVLVALAGVAAAVATADDRDLLRDSEGDPYAFIILDTSASMHWSTGCTETDAAFDVDPWDGMCTRECSAETSVCQDFDPGGGCVEYNVQYDDENPPAVHDLFIDDNTAGQVAVSGTWTAVTAAATPFVGSRYIHDGDAGKGSKSVTFTPTLPEQGFYHVYLFYTADPANAENVPVTVHYASGSDTVRVDQTRNSQEDSSIDRHPGVDPEHYNYLGTFPFNMGTGPAGEAGAEVNSVVIETDNTSGLVVVDSVRFFAVSRPAGLSCQRAGYRFRQPVCPRGDCYALASADDPSSKMFQVKEAMYEVLDVTPDVSFGFATYEQDDGRVEAKHWLYRVPELKPDGSRQDYFTTQLPSVGEFPVPGSQWVFGMNDAGWNCITGGGDPADPEGNAARVGCETDNPADADNLWEMERARRIPKLGIDGNTPTEVWYREPTTGQVYRVTVSPNSGSYGDQVIAIDLEFEICNNSNCTNTTSVGNAMLYFERVTDFVAADFRLSRFPMHQNGFFQNRRTVEAQFSLNVALDHGCQGLEPNDDRDATVDVSLAANDDDMWELYTPKWLTTADARGPLLEVGDFVPLDWQTTHRGLIMGRMAPNLYDPVTGDFDAGLGRPDFRTATYWNDNYLSGDNPSSSLRKLRLKDDDQSALMPFGATPLAASLDDFRLWYAGADATSDADGWAGLAKTGDPLWQCRDTYVIFVTDGNESCGGDPCTAAANLMAEDVKTFVIGFGVQEDCTDGRDNDSDGAIDGADTDCQAGGDPDAILSETKLGCMAENGGTEEPILPRNKDELVEALESLFSQIIPVPKTFAAASIPALQSSAADKIYLSSFVPLPGESVWPGRIDAFRQPLPLDAENKPDTARDCNSTRQSGCHLWETGTRLLSQAEINDATLDLLQVEDDVTVWAGELKIGDTTTTRRVVYPQQNLTGVRPSELTLYRPPKTVFAGGTGTPDTADLEDLAEVLAPGSLGAFYANSITDKDLQEAVNAIIKRTLRPRQLGEASDSFEGRPTYLLGDVFHSDPVVVTSPNDFVYFASDLCGRIQSDGVPNNCVAGVDRGYRKFTEKHVWRRRMLTAATNDGQLHFFDAGILVEGEQRLPDGQLREFRVLSDGSGGELFSYMPRLTLPVVRQQALGNRHIYSLDGTLTIRDVFIDPITDGSGAIAPGEREWRTVLLAGLREAGDVHESAATVSGLYSGYFALDLTQPDQLDSDLLPIPRFTRPTPDDVVNVSEMKLPSCLDFDYGGDGHQTDPLGCTHRFPMELWTFTDAVDNHVIWPPFLDEDANGVRDLGDTWSTPIVGQIAVCAPGASACDPDDPTDDEDLITKHVAIFGGGMDPANKTNPLRGNWLYIVDVETGEAIYKRQLEGAAPAPPTVLDLDRDGIFDVIYQATTAGFVYKVDLDGRDASGELPDLAFKDVLDTNGTTHSNKFLRVDDNGAWDPYKILATANGVPLYFSPVAFFIPELGHYGLAIGTGEREDLWEETHTEGRFYVIVDEGITRAQALASGADPCETRVPLEDACLEVIAWDQDPAVVTAGLDDLVQRNVLINDDPGDDKQGGWVMTFPEEFRITSRPFVISSVLVFSTFQPAIFFTSGSGTTTCAQTGTTRSFVVQVQNATPLARLSAADQGTGGGVTPTTGAYKAEDRFLVTDEFTTSPFVIPPSKESGGSGTTILDLVEEDVQNGVRQAIIDTFPRGSRFNETYQLPIAALRNSTGVEVLATIPVAVYPADWRDP